jgi:hypothetical protein
MNNDHAQSRQEPANESLEAQGAPAGEPGGGDGRSGPDGPAEGAADATAPSEKGPAKDIGPLLNGWDYEPGTINVRKIHGSDGQPKLQMRLDLGLLQMEMTGRPDGVRPHGCESLLEHFEGQLDGHRTRNGTELGFQLTGEQCRCLREEAVMYYHRYLSLFVLEDFDGVVRDTARNIRVIDLCSRHAASERDRIVLEQYRPYLTMMNTRAKASLLVKDRKYDEALRTIKVGLGSIRRFFRRFGQEEEFDRSNEVLVLRRVAREIRRKLPVDEMKVLNRRLQDAVRHERYEQAAMLRDEIQRRSVSVTTAAAPEPAAENVPANGDPSADRAERGDGG